ncbi:hypothetical protein DY000_02001540 [Brassica cretica]|uniref:Uncharacterized protein n=1 Tax=Brassica cretica TaxID=69181 RepID=A0ABQ7C553_BRACR|nr:hypothetical protein DY000_02001540 [Brassica cretica]
MIVHDWDPGAQRLLKIQGSLYGIGISQKICGDLRNRIFVTVCKETLWKPDWDGDTIGISPKGCLSRSSEWMRNPEDQPQELRGKFGLWIRFILAFLEVFIDTLKSG